MLFEAADSQKSAARCVGRIIYCHGQFQPDYQVNMMMPKMKEYLLLIILRFAFCAVIIFSDGNCSIIAAI